MQRPGAVASLARDLRRDSRQGQGRPTLVRGVPNCQQLNDGKLETASLGTVLYAVEVKSLSWGLATNQAHH